MGTNNEKPNATVPARLNRIPPKPERLPPILTCLRRLKYTPSLCVQLMSQSGPEHARAHVHAR